MNYFVNDFFFHLGVMMGRYIEEHKDLWSKEHDLVMDLESTEDKTTN